MIFQIKCGKIEKWLEKAKIVFGFGISYFEPNSNLSENTNFIGSNVENDAVRYRIYFDHFHPYSHSPPMPHSPPLHCAQAVAPVLALLYCCLDTCFILANNGGL
jgi:hypothetical protein